MGLQPRDTWQLAKELWDDSKGSLDLFFNALASPRSVIELWDKNSTETVRRAFVFSLLPVAIALVVNLPYIAVYLPNDITFTYMFGSFAQYYMQMAIASLMLFAVGWLLRGKASLRDCFTASLVFMANLWPANEILAYGMKTNKVFLCARLTGTVLSPSWAKVEPSYVNYYALLQLPLILYLFVVIPPAIRSIERVGRWRAVLIFILYTSCSSLATDLLLKPLWAKTLGACT